MELLVSQAYSNYYLLIDATGIPLAVGRSAANTHDSLLLKQLVDAVPAIIGRRGRPVDPGQAARRQRRRRPEPPAAAPPQQHHAADRPPWLLANRRRTVRYQRRVGILTALLHVACAVLCAGRLRPLQRHP